MTIKIQFKVCNLLGVVFCADSVGESKVWRANAILWRANVILLRANAEEILPFSDAGLLQHLH